MSSVVIKDRRGEGEKRPCEDRGRDWNDTATHQESLGHQKLEETRQDSGKSRALTIP